MTAPLVTKRNSGGRWHAWFGSDDGTEAAHVVGGYRSEEEAASAARCLRDSGFVRYVDPLAALRGAIGLAAAGGAIIGGRMRRGETVPARYVVTDGTSDGVAFDTWQGAADALATWIGSPVDVAPSVDGFVCVVHGIEYRLTVV